MVKPYANKVKGDTKYIFNIKLGLHIIFLSRN